MSKSKSKNKARSTMVTAQHKAPRMLWGPGGGRLFGPDGTEYRCSEWELPAKEVKRAVRRGQIPFAVKECGCGVEWIAPADTATVWNRVRPDFEDVDDWKPPADAPGAQPYRATLWKALTGGHSVLLLSDE